MVADLSTKRTSRNNRKVCVIGERTQEELFEEDETPWENTSGSTMYILQVMSVHKYLEGGGFETDGDIFIL